MTALLLLLLAPASRGSKLQQPACDGPGRVDNRLRGGAAQRTFAMLKPDIATDEATVRQIKARIEDAGLAIEREERHLEAVFGPDWLAYRGRVRRWVGRR